MVPVSHLDILRLLGLVQKQVVHLWFRIDYHGPLEDLRSLIKRERVFIYLPVSGQIKWTPRFSGSDHLETVTICDDR